MPRPLTRDLARLVAAGAVTGTLIVVFAIWRIDAAGRRDDARPADAIVVMGAAQYDGRPSPVFRARLDHAVALFHKGLAPVLVVTGGRADGDRTTEAATARAYAIARGVPPEAILSESGSRTTLQSVRAVAALLADHDLGSALFVSDRTHMLRVLRMAADEGIVAWGSPTTTSPIEADAVSRLDATVHELGALAVYFVTGESP